MKLRIEPVFAIILSIIMSYAWSEVTNEPACPTYEFHKDKWVLVPYLCKDVLVEEE